MALPLIKLFASGLLLAVSMSSSATHDSVVSDSLMQSGLTVS